MDTRNHKITIHNVIRTFCHKDWYWDTRKDKMPCFNYWVVLKGKGEIETVSASHTLRAGSSLLLRYGEGYLATHNPGHPLHVIAARFDFLDSAGKITHPTQNEIPALYHQLSELHFNSDLLKRMENCWGTGDYKGSALWLKAALHERQRQIESLLTDTPAGELEAFIHFIRQQIREHPQNKWQVDRLALQAHCTRHHFSRKFKEMTGVSPNEYIIRARTDRAGELLINSSHSIERIAEITGYNDVYFFSRQFRKVTGVPPSVFRKKKGLTL